MRSRRSEAVWVLEHQLALELDDASRRQAGDERIRKDRWEAPWWLRFAEGSALCRVAVGEIVVRIGEVRVVEDVVEVSCQVRTANLSVNLKFLLMVKSESKKPGPRNPLRIWLGNAAVAVANWLNARHLLKPLTQLPCAGPKTCASGLSGV